MAKMLDAKEVRRHNNKNSCWVILYGNVWDVTDFLPLTPGGALAILRHAGRDATATYDPIHAPGLLESTLPASCNLGPVDPSTIQSGPDPQTAVAKSGPAPLGMFINLEDFQAEAEKRLEPAAWAHYSTSTDAEVSIRLNRVAFEKIMMRPRILRDMRTVDTRSKILGYDTTLPVYVTAFDMAKGAHPNGEAEITKAAGLEGLVHLVSTYASVGIARVAETWTKNQIGMFQLYVYPEKEKTIELIRKAEKLGYKAIWVTVDLPVLSKRERVARVAALVDEDPAAGEAEKEAVAGALIDINGKSLNWEDLKWIRETTSLPIVLKGIQSVEDAVMAVQYGVQGIVLSNHGARGQDTAQPPMLTLLEIRKYAPYVFDHIEVYVDGMVRRGTDVLKAIALGATAVGIGRPALFSLAVGHGYKGVRKMIDILRDEVVTNMGLMGATTIKEVTREMVNTTLLEREMTGAVKL